MIGAPDTEKKQVTWADVLAKLGISPINLIMVLAFVSYIGYTQFNKQPQPVTPAPVPVVPAPGQKTLANLVSPDAAVELANLYHAFAVQLYNDKARVENADEKVVIETIEDFYQMQQYGMQSFQNSLNITGISAINEPISTKLKVATGTLNPAKKIDDPATKVRDSLIASCKQISEEFDPRYRLVSLSQFK